MHVWLLDYHLAMRTSSIRATELSLDVNTSGEDHKKGEEKSTAKTPEQKKVSLVLLNYIQRRQLYFLASLLIKTEHVSTFTNAFDELIHEELKR
jgi:hypothetical protein